MLAQMPRLAWDNAAHSLLERTLDDSANRRTLLPESFLLSDELLHVTRRIISGLVVNQDAMNHNLDVYGPFAAVERVLMGVTRAGADRQEMHERLRNHAMQAWSEIHTDEPNPLGQLVANDPELLKYLSANELNELMDARQHIGDSPQRALQLADEIVHTVANSH